MSKQVECITKKPSHYDAHERIQGIGGKAGGGWWRAEVDAIRDVEKDPSSYYVSVSGKSVWVIVSSHNGGKYLKTTSDDYAPNNLLNLPDCPQ